MPIKGYYRHPTAIS